MNKVIEAGHPPFFKEGRVVQGCPVIIKQKWEI